MWNAGWLVKAATIPGVRTVFNVALPLAVQVFPGGQVLTVASARASDAGGYSCIAVNTVGEDRRDIVVQVHSESLAWDGMWGVSIAKGRPFQEAELGGHVPWVSEGEDGKDRSYHLTLWLPVDPRDLSWGVSIPVGGQVAGKWPHMSRSSVVREEA